MKNFIVIVLSLIFISSISRDALTIAYFHLNRTYIASTLCVNKDKPQMCCKGKCVLQKRLKENNDQENENPAKRIADNLEQKFMLEPKFNFENILIINQTSSNPYGSQSLHHKDYLSLVFHPPETHL